MQRPELYLSVFAYPVKAFRRHTEPRVFQRIDIHVFRPFHLASYTPHKLFQISIEPVFCLVEQCISRTQSYPQEIGSVHQADYIIVGDGCRILGKMPVDLKTISVITVQSGSCPEPHETVLIFQNGINGVIGKSVSHLQMLEHEIPGGQWNHNRQKT